MTTPASRQSAAAVLTREQRSFLREVPPKEAPVEKPPESPPRSVRGQARQSVTVRLSPVVVRALRRAAAQRTLDYREPYTQQAIAEAGLMLWLRREGYLDENNVA